MKRLYGILLVMFFSGCHYIKSPEMRLCTRLDWQSVIDLFPKNVQQITNMKKKSIMIMDEMLRSLQSLEGKSHNFHNTVRVYDNAKFKFMMNLQILSTLEKLSPDEQLQVAAGKAVHQLLQYQADHVVRNPILLQAFRDYAQYGHDDQSKSAAVRLFLQKSINRLEHEGANLSPELLAKLTEIAQNISDLESSFYSRIVNQHKSINLTEKELAGVPVSSLESLKKTNNGYVVPLDYEQFFNVLENCSVAATRKKFFIHFNQRVYPANEETLKKLIARRNEYAQLVGYKNFAEYECSLQMVGSVEQAHDFIVDILAQSNKIVAQEFKKIEKELPASVSLTSSGKLEPWDEAFVRSSYRKKHFAIDASQVAQYFPVTHVLDQLQKQFGQFFALSFDQIENNGLWSQDLTCWQVRLLKTNQIIGYLVFDLYARPGKSHQACQINVIPTIQDDCNLICSGLSTIITNFVKAESGKETLLEFHDVKILLHEFGHALHELFGATEFVDTAGSKGPRDFMEMPSQLLELWMDDPMMIKQFSKHVVTNKPLSDEMIAKMIAAEKFGRASLLQRQCLLSLISLEFGSQPQDMQPHEIVAKLYKQARIDVEYCPLDYFETSFEHLVSYGSHYYGYVWSQVLAAGIFEYVVKHGIRDHQVGQKLYDRLFSHGGSHDPHQLIEMLLGTSITKKSLFDSLQQSK